MVVEVDLVRFGLPVGGEDYNGLGLDLLSDLLADCLEDRIHGMCCIVLYIGLRLC